MSESGQEIESNDSPVTIYIIGSSSLSGSSVEDVLEQTSDELCQEMLITDAGNIVTDGGVAYYWGCYDPYGYNRYSCIITYFKDDKFFSFMMSKEAKAGRAWEEAIKIGDSYQFE